VDVFNSGGEWMLVSEDVNLVCEDVESSTGEWRVGSKCSQCRQCILNYTTAGEWGVGSK
jgi:hypothetical protein